MEERTGTTLLNDAGKSLNIIAATSVLLLSASVVSAASVSSVDQAVNIFTSGTVTGGLPLTVDVGGPTPIAPGTEFPGFAFGTYDVDASADSITMTFVNDPNALGIAQYDASTVDQYYFEFDREIASASFLSMTTGFSATVDIIAAGSTAASVGAFVPGLPTSFTFDNGGILISIGQGTDLFEVATGGSLTVGVSAVPLPASLPLLALAFGGLGLIRRKAKKAA